MRAKTRFQIEKKILTPDENQEEEKKQEQEKMERAKGGGVNVY